MTDSHLTRQPCNYDILTDSIRRDQIVIGIKDTKLLERQLQGRNLNQENSKDMSKRCYKKTEMQLHWINRLSQGEIGKWKDKIK